MKHQSIAGFSVGLALHLMSVCAPGQGTFQNLDFEAGHVPTPPLYDGSFSAVLPGWSGTLSNGSGVFPVIGVAYDSVSLGGAGIAIIDTLNVGAKPLQGNYSAYLFGGNTPFGGPTSTTISQTGLVPNGAKYMLIDMVAQDGVSVSLNGQSISMWTSDGRTFGVDISAFAGQTAQLSITALPPPLGGIDPNGVLVDDIRFETIPEPSVLGLAALGALLTARRIYIKEPSRKQRPVYRSGVCGGSFPAGKQPGVVYSG